MAVPINEAIRVAEFRVALRSFLHNGERVAARCGLTPQRYLLLLLIKGAPDGSETATVTDLAERLYLAQSTVTELVTRAENAGLVERTTSPDDARLAPLRLTREGERRLACAFRGLAEQRDRLLRVVEELNARV